MELHKFWRQKRQEDGALKRCSKYQNKMVKGQAENSTSKTIKESKSLCTLKIHQVFEKHYFRFQVHVLQISILDNAQKMCCSSLYITLLVKLEHLKMSCCANPHFSKNLLFICTFHTPQENFYG